MKRYIRATVSDNLWDIQDNNLKSVVNKIERYLKGPNVRLFSTEFRSGIKSCKLSKNISIESRYYEGLHEVHILVTAYSDATKIYTPYIYRKRGKTTPEPDMFYGNPEIQISFVFDAVKYEGNVIVNNIKSVVASMGVDFNFNMYREDAEILEYPSSTTLLDIDSDYLLGFISQYLEENDIKIQNAIKRRK